ncbi:MAG: hypothetical protein ACYCW6_17345 [Candidatus Xenobia bacterium]
MYWKKPAWPENLGAPEAAGAGVLWICGTLPWRGAEVATALRQMEDIILRRGFDPMLAIIGHTDRTFHLAAMLVWDRESPGADGCGQELAEHLNSRGYLPYRLGFGRPHPLPASIDDSHRLLSRLKATLDPSDILAPGRYDFR